MKRLSPLFACVVLFVAVITTPSLLGQVKDTPLHPTVIRGVVRDAVSHVALEHASVTLELEDSGYAGQAETDTSGKFTVEGTGSNVFVVTAKYPGYQSSSQRVDLSRGSSGYLMFDLKSNHPPNQNTLINSTPRNAAVPENAQKEYDAARKLFEQNKVGDEASQHLKKAIQIYPAYGDAYVLLAIADIGETKLADARALLDKAIQVNPNLSEAYLTLGMLLNHQQDYAGAEKNLVRGLELNPNAPQGHYELAKTLWAAGKWQDAEPHAQKALELKPDMAPAHVLLGNIALRKHDAQGALREFKEYLRMDPTGQMAAGAQQMVTKIEEALKHPQ